MPSKCWRRSLGERGLRVYLFERKPGGTLYREVYAGGRRIASKRSLGHRDREQAEADGYRLLSKLKAREEALRGGKLTLSLLFDNYVESPAHGAKKPRTRREDKSKLKRLCTFLGAERDVRSLSESDVERYRQARMRGDNGKRGVNARTVQADVIALCTMLNWATRQRNGSGDVLLDRNPLRGIKLPGEKNPKRPVETYDRYLKLMEVADDVDWRLGTALTLVESTGRRLSSVLRLRRRDFDLERPPHGWVRFRAEHDKTGHEQWVPLTETARKRVTAHLESDVVEAVGWLFPADRDNTKPVDRSVISRKLREAYERAELETLDGGLWHPWRRKWATERKNMPLRDVQEAGGWRDPRTLLESYQRADEATLTHVTLTAPKLYRNGLDNGEPTPNATPPSKRNGAR